MGYIHLGPKQSEPVSIPSVVNNEVVLLKTYISNLEQQLTEKKVHTVFVDVIKEVKVEIPKEVIKEITVVQEKIVEKPIEIIKHVYVDVPREIKVVEERVVEKIKEVFIDKKFTSGWIKGVLAFQTLLIIVLLIK